MGVNALTASQLHITVELACVFCNQTPIAICQGSRSTTCETKNVPAPMSQPTAGARNHLHATSPSTTSFRAMCG